MKKTKNQETGDVWFEIFLHLPLESIFKFKCISKVWCSTLSSPIFIKHWYKLNISSLPWGLVSFASSVEDHYPDTHKLRREFAIAYPNSHLQLAHQHQTGFSFGFLDTNFLVMDEHHQRKNLYLLGSSNGLVLCRAKNSSNQRIYYVCNPLTKKWVSIPPIPIPEVDFFTGFMCNDECFSSSLISTSFKVFRISKFEVAAKEFNVAIFSSELGEWDIIDVACQGDVTWNFSYYDNLITHNGAFYWFQKKSRKILVVNLNGNECRLINLPGEAMDGDIKLRQCLGESQGLICYAIVDEKQRSLSVWVLGKDWSLLCKDDKFDILLAEMEPLLTGEIGKINFIKRLKILGFNPFDKDVVILGYGSYIVAYNTRTKGYEQLLHPYFLCLIEPVPSKNFLTFTFKPRPTVLPPASWPETL